jgi:hypothetical protein
MKSEIMSFINFSYVWFTLFRKSGLPYGGEALNFVVLFVSDKMGSDILLLLVLLLLFADPKRIL